MRRVICFATVLLMCISLVCPVFAAEFVPSISAKDHPEVVPTKDGYPAMLCDDDGNVVAYLEDGCIVITPVSEAETSTEIPEDAREQLIEVYEGLKDGSIKIPYEDDTDWVVRDLFDISFLCEDHPKMMAEGANLVITFDLGVSANTDVNVMVYNDGKWNSAIKVVNNGDGTVTITLDQVGAVAFSVPADTYDTPAQTGDVAGFNLVIWIAVMTVAAAAVVFLLVFRRRIIR